MTGTLPSATDADGDPVTYGMHSAARHGTAEVDANGSFRYTPSPDYFGLDSFHYVVTDGRGGARAYTVSIAVAMTLTPLQDSGPPPPDGKKIAFVSARDGNDEIYVVNSDGTGLVRITNDLANDREPAWSPDGTRIAFVSDRAGQPDIYVMNADGSQVVRRTFEGSYTSSPAWSPDGTKIAYATLSDGSSNIWVVGAGNDGVLPTPLFSKPGYDAQPAWSPDGTKIALVSDWNAYDFVYDIFVISTTGAGTEFTALTGDIFDHVDYLHPSWSPDGARIATAITEVIGIDQYVTNLGVMNADGTGLTPLVSAATWTKSSWSADGRRIVFTSGSGTARNVAWVASDGSAYGVIITDGWDPSWQR